MGATLTRIPSGLRWQYWITVLRILFSLIGLIMGYVIPQNAYGREVFAAPVILFMLIPLLLCLVNDILLLTFDVKRTGWFLGTVFAQAAFILLSLGTAIVLMCFPWFFGAWRTAMQTCWILYMLCTLCLGTHILVSKRRAGEQACWKSNVKDMLVRTSSNQDRASLFGRPRDPALSMGDVSNFRYLWAVFAPRVLLRRVSPVESKHYALFQNTCALLFTAAVVMRAVMALSQAQNQMETRTTAGPCEDMSNEPVAENVRVLMRHKYPNGGYDVTVSLVTLLFSAQEVQYQCTPGSVKDTSGSYPWNQFFNCGSYEDSRDFFYSTYNITIRSTNGTSLDEMQLPSVWLVNSADSARGTVKDDSNNVKSLAPSLVPAWRLVGGKRIQASVDVAERRFIVSSFFRDIIANLKPTYKSTSLFTIVTRDATPSTDKLTTTALLTMSRMSSLSYLSHYDSLNPDPLMDITTPICAYIEDYRSSTILDALGSIGGLFAILQGVHILLFGRPLFWGITGAKLISPFGIFGRCHSDRFRRQFREKYYRRSMSDPSGETAEIMRIDAFLRDFVIDFGPADTDEGDAESGQNNRHRKILSEANRSDSTVRILTCGS